MVFEGLRFKALFREFLDCVEKGMTREEIRRKLNFHSPCLVDSLAYVLQVKIRRE